MHVRSKRYVFYTGFLHFLLLLLFKSLLQLKYLTFNLGDKSVILLKTIQFYNK